ncbi:unnamed protein product [Ceutorhynchus assimilis]|uniref:Myb/SANT-like DNA-binding domain-containing protein n=1 Tax=Ceutorhynchus assimilis TaxID=467358 RepID=A0A9N9MEX3_9CUCU|nr:unnamed protein product [Ceutorhynchus assimilis]
MAKIPPLLILNLGLCINFLVIHASLPKAKTVFVLDDDFLLDYVCRAVQCQRIPFCSIEDLPTLTITRFTDSTIANIPGPSSADSTKTTQPLYTASSNVIDHDSLINNQPSSQPSDKVAPAPVSHNKKQVWVTKGKPSQDDKEATYQMLQLRASDKFVKKFNDKSSVKLELWKEIANTLLELGFDVDARSCRQKFSNLYTKYIKFKQHVKTTGEGKREPPEFYIIMDQILGEKDKVNLQYVTDTLDPVEVIYTWDSDDENVSPEIELNTSMRDHQPQKKHSNKSQPSSQPSTSKNGVLPNNDKEKSSEKSTQKRHTTTKTEILNTITNTLAVSEKAVRTAISKRTVEGIVPFDKRVGALPYANLKQKDEFMRASALAHIQKFPKMESLFYRKSTSKKYLHPDLNVKQTVNLYQEESLEQPKCSYHTYFRVFESLNLSFHDSRKDQCSLCLSYREGDANKKLEFQDAYTANVAEKNTVCKKKEDAKEMPKNNPALITAAVFDMQQVIQLPKVKKMHCLIVVVCWYLPSVFTI